jgi:hypothetical protein
VRRPAIGGPVRGTPFGVFALRLLLDFVLAIASPRAALVAENLILRQQLRSHCSEIRS